MGGDSYAQLTAKHGSNRKIKKKLNSKIAQTSMQIPQTTKINSSGISSLRDKVHHPTIISNS